MNEDDLEVLKLLEEYAVAREMWFSGTITPSYRRLELESEVAETRARLLAKLGIPEVSDE